MRNLPESQRDDADLCADVLQALALDSTIPASVDAKTNDGLVIPDRHCCLLLPAGLGRVHLRQRTWVLDINDEVTLMSAPCSDHIEHEIIAALRRSARLAVDDLSADARPDGTVILSGTVTSCPEHNDALAAAWSARGITEVDDRVIVI